MCRRILALVLLIAATACTQIPFFSPLPIRDADLYPDSQTKAGIAVAVDQLTYPRRVERYFGVDLLKSEVLPISIIVSNHGQNRYVIKPSDVLLMHGNDVIDPVPMDAVGETFYDEYGRISKEVARKIESYFGKVMLQETVVGPHDNYQGMIFLKPDRRKGERNDGDTTLNIAHVLKDAALKVRIAVTDLETHERIHFGPFSLSGL